MAVCHTVTALKMAAFNLCAERPCFWSCFTSCAYRCGFAELIKDGGILNLNTQSLWFSVMEVYCVPAYLWKCLVVQHIYGSVPFCSIVTSTRLETGENLLA